LILISSETVIITCAFQNAKDQYTQNDIFCGWETWSAVLGEESKLQVSGSKMFRNICEVSGSHGGKYEV
jgi:hypothetical protein